MGLSVCLCHTHSSPLLSFFLLSSPQDVAPPSLLPPDTNSQGRRMSPHSSHPCAPVPGLYPQANPFVCLHWPMYFLCTGIDHGVLPMSRFPAVRSGKQREAVCVVRRVERGRPWWLCTVPRLPMMNLR